MTSLIAHVAVVLAVTHVLVWLADGPHAAAALFTALWIAGAISVTVVASVAWAVMSVGSWIHGRSNR